MSKKRKEHKWISGVECKWCNICKEWKPLDCFSKDVSKWDGLNSRCKNCEKQYRSETVEKRKQYNKQYRIKYKDKIKQQRKEYDKQYLIDRVEERKQYYIDNAEKIKQRIKQYNKEHRAERNALEAKREAAKLNQTPENANLKEIQFLYDVCAETNELLGGTYFHVDHIQPLSKGGLHHEDNLQILEAELNMEKNATWPLTGAEEIKYAGVTFNANQ